MRVACTVKKITSEKKSIKSIKRDLIFVAQTRLKMNSRTSSTPRTSIKIRLNVYCPVSKLDNPASVWNTFKLKTLWIWNWKSEIPHNTGADVYEDNTKLSNQTKGKTRKAKGKRNTLGPKKSEFAIVQMFVSMHQLVTKNQIGIFCCCCW